MNRLKYMCTVLVCIFMLSCSESTNNTSEKKPEPEPKVLTNVLLNHSGMRYINRYDFEEAGMRYVVYREVDGGLIIINMTKDSLEVEHLRNLKNY